MSGNNPAAGVPPVPPVPTPATPPPPPPAATPPETDPTAGDTAKTYTQAEVDALDRKLQAKAAKAAEAKILEELGGSSAEIKKILEAQRAAEDAQKTEAQRATEAATAREAEATAAMETARMATLRATLSQALMLPGEDPETAPGLRPDRLEVALQLAMPTASSFDGEPADAVKAGVDYVRANAAEFFGTIEGAPKAPTSPGTPGRTASERPKTVATGFDPASAILERTKGPSKSALPPIPGLD